MLSIALMLLTIVIYIKLNKLQQFTLLSLSALLPFTYGSFRSIPNFLFIEWLTAVTLIILLFELAPPFFSGRKTPQIAFNGTGLFLLAIVILATWSIISILNNEIFANQLISGDQTGTKRTYFNIFNNILLFFTTVIFVSVYFKEINFEKYFKILLISAIVLGVLRIATHFGGFRIPFMANLFEYGGEFGSKAAQAKYGGVAYRLGGLTNIVIVGIPALFALAVIKGKLNWFALIILFFLLFLSGGRTVLAGMVFSIIVFAFLLYPRYIIYFAFAGVAFIVILGITLPDTVIKGQTGRLTKMSDGSYIGQDNARAMAWKLYLENFEKYPVFGKGIKQYDTFFYTAKEEIRDFAKYQQFSGGHGSYFSLMSTFGIGGLLYFVLMVFGGIILSYRKVRQYSQRNSYKTGIAVFVLMLLLAKAFDFISGGNGLSVPILFFATGFIASLIVIENGFSEAD